MADAAESSVALIDDSSSTGKAIRNLAILARQADGTFKTVYMQGTVVMDADTGQPAQFYDRDYQRESLRALRKIARGIEQAFEIDILDGEGEER